MGYAASYAAVRRYAKKLEKASDESPVGVATLHMPWLARRFFRGHNSVSVKALVQHHIYILTSRSVEVIDVLVIHDIVFGTRYVKLLTLTMKPKPSS